MKFSEISNLFDRAIAISDTGERNEFVIKSCPDQKSRTKLQSLISAHYKNHGMVDNLDAVADVARNFNKTLSAHPHRESPVGEGDRLGNYKLLQLIGEGGMGYVFMADQLAPIQRRVAVKVIKTSGNSRHVLTRFEAERSALARLDHPNITRIFDAGAAESGAPYFVMELVRGDSLTDYCDRQKFSIDQRVELVELICQAVHHAHQKGIIHRDIKPSNVMVTQHDGVPVPKIIDFGIAKALDRPLVEGTLFTRYGDMVGTPQYMSPEQAEESGLDLDVRTDIYSLGAVLFELLTGTPPIEQATLEGKGVLGVLETVRDHETETPSTRVTRSMASDKAIASARGTEGRLLPRTLRGELDWIAMKSLARDRSLRYESAAAMGRDLRAYLAGGVVEAAAPSFLYQAKKLFQRHRSASVMAMASLLMMLAVTLVSFSWAISNNRLKEVATARAQQLNRKNEELEQQKSTLHATLQRAKTAESQALVLVNEKKEQAALDRAMRRHFVKVFTAINAGKTKIGDESFFAEQGGEPSELATEIKQAVLQSMERIAEITAQMEDPLPPLTTTQPPAHAVAPRQNAEVQPIVRLESALQEASLSTSDLKSEAQKRPEASQRRDLQRQFDDILSAAKSSSRSNGLASLSPHVKTMMASSPSQLGGLIVEEFRAEFGESHPKVAEALVHIARIELSTGEIKSKLLESRLREAIAIAQNGSPQQSAVIGIESRVLLAEFFHRMDRTGDATKQLEIAKTGFKAGLSNLTQSQQDVLAKEVADLEALLDRPAATDSQ